MTDASAPSRPYGGTTRAAWLATATGIPIYVVVTAILWGPAVAVYSAIADQPDASVDTPSLGVIAAVSILMVVAGIAAVAHTVGRLVFAPDR